jgi:hypothetical protein
MSRFRIAAALCLAACAVWMLSSHDGKVAEAVRAEHAAMPRESLEPAPEPRPSALLAQFGEPRSPNPGGSAPTDRFDFSADGRRMLASGGGTVRTWDVPNGRLLASFPVPPADTFSGPARAAISPDGRWALTSSTYDMRTVVRDAETGQVAGDPQRYKEKLLAGLDGTNRAWMWDRYGLDLTSYLLPGGPAGRTMTPPPGFLLFSPDSRWLVSSADRDALRIRDTRARDSGWVELESYRDQPLPACGRVPPACAVPVRFSPDGRFLLTWWRGFNLWHITERPLRVVRLTEVRDHTRFYPDATFSPDGRRLAAVEAGEIYSAQPGRKGSVRVWETASGSEAFRFDPPGGATGCAFTPDGKRLIVAHPDTTFSVWDYATLEARAVRAQGDVWERLTSREGKTGLGAIDALVADPTAVPYLRDRFRPADAELVARLIAELGDEDFPTREAAEKGLAALGERAEKALFEAVTTSPSPEVRGRANRLLAPISGPHSTARLRAGRAVEALERIGTPAAKELLSEWTERGPALAAEANAALGRLARPR